MLLKLSKNAFVRQYGDFTYIRERVTSYDEMFEGGEVFMRGITRLPREKSEILKEICSAYIDADNEEIARDFDEFLAPLIASKVVLAGKTVEELEASEVSFSYDVADPKTTEDTRRLTKEEADFLPQKVLGEYFEAHPTLFRLQMDITQACTERCIHCYIPEYKPLFLPFDKICEVIDEFREMGGLDLTLSGGECMLHPDFERIVRYARSKDLIVCILSNLTLCDDKKIALLKECEVPVQVSLYSMNPEIHDSITKRKGSWQETMTAIRKLRENHIPCLISCPTMKQNYEGYLQVIEFARSLKMHAQTDFIIMGQMNGDTSNVTNCRLDLVQTRHLLEDIVFRAVPMNSEYFNPMKKNDMLSPEEWMANKICGAGIDSMCLDADGHYYPCPAFGGYDLGNCYSQSLKDVWENSPAIQKLRSVRGKDFPKCASCKDRDYCSVCMCRNFNEGNDIFTPAEHFCKVAEINHQVVDELHKKILSKC